MSYLDKNSQLVYLNHTPGKMEFKMEPSHLIPLPDPIPVPWGWVQFLLLLTFVLHLLFMNTMLGTGIIAFVHHVHHVRRPRSNFPLTADIAKNLPYTIAFTINMGVAPLLFLQVLYGHFMYVSSILMAAYWLSIIGLLVIAYYSAYLYDFKYDSLGLLRPFFIGLTVLIFLFIGFLFTNNITLMLNPEAWKAYFERPDGTLLNLSDPTLWPRYLHFITASVAIGGLSIAIIARFRPLKDMRAQEDRIALGMQWFSYATLAQIAIGLWFLFLTMVFGSITGVGIWFVISVVNPSATSDLIHNFVFGWATEWVF